MLERGILSRATKGKVALQRKQTKNGIIVKDNEFYKPILNTLPTR